MPSYLLLESGDRLLTEDAGGGILLGGDSVVIVAPSYPSRLVVDTASISIKAGTPDPQLTRPAIK